jgi:hypothetical protein
MSKSLTLRALPILVVGAALIACGDQARSDASESNTPAAEPTGVGWKGVIEAPPLAEAVPGGVGWDGVVHAPPLAATAVAVATATLQQPPAADAAGRDEHNMCTLRPEANTLPPVAPVLLSTILNDGDHIEVLHRVECDGRTITWTWLSTTDILAL